MNKTPTASVHPLLTITVIIACQAVLVIAVLLLIYGDELDILYNVIGIRIATLFVAFAAFCSTTAFSYLIFRHNKAVQKSNEDANRRGRMYREQQFASSNYSIIEFMDRMLLYTESSWYIERFVCNRSLLFHMIYDGLTEEEIFADTDNFHFVSVRIPFRVIEGKIVASVGIDRVRFERDGRAFVFKKPDSEREGEAFILYNEHTRRNNVIFNLIVPKNSEFFDPSKVNVFSKITITFHVNSLLGVRTSGISELYFTNPTQSEGDGTNTYRINSSNFSLVELPHVVVKKDENS